MANLASNANYINDVETTQGAPVSEATVQRLGASVNYCLDGVAALNALNLLVSTPVAFAFTSISGSGSYTTPNLKQIYAAFGIAAGAPSYPTGGATNNDGVVGNAAVNVIQGQTTNWYYNDGGNKFRRTLVIGGANNRTLTQTYSTSAAGATSYLLVIYEP